MSAPPTILLIDDYADALTVWEFFLTSAGYSVMTASNGADAIALAETTLPAVVVTDLELPGMSGFDIARHFRSQPHSRHIPLIAATGYAHVVDSPEGRAAFDSVMVKPCAPDVLLREIQRLIAHSQGTLGNDLPTSGSEHQ